MNKKQPKKNFTYTCIVIPVAVANGILGGISSVIASYFFKPAWDKITKLWESKDK